MSTLTIAIGNSDDKLSQRRWAEYWGNVGALVDLHAEDIYGVFLTQPASPWQSACWVIEGELTAEFRDALALLAQLFDQDSIAVSVGETELVRPS